MNKKVIDWKLGEELANGNKDLAKELIQLLIESLPEFKKDLANAKKQNDFAILSKAAHKLHGGTCYTGTPRLKEAAKNLEIAAKENQVDSIDALYDTLMKEIDAVEKAL